MSQESQLINFSETGSGACVRAQKSVGWLEPATKTNTNKVRREENDVEQ